LSKSIEKVVVRWRRLFYNRRKLVTAWFNVFFSNSNI